MTNMLPKNFLFNSVSILIFNSLVLNACGNPRDESQERAAKNERKSKIRDTATTEVQTQNLVKSIQGTFFTSHYIWLPNCDASIRPNQYFAASDEAWEEWKNEQNGKLQIPLWDDAGDQASYCVKIRK